MTSSEPLRLHCLHCLLSPDPMHVHMVLDVRLTLRYTWNVESQELCPGVDGKCSKEEL